MQVGTRRISRRADFSYALPSDDRLTGIDVFVDIAHMSVAGGVVISADLSVVNDDIVSVGIVEVFPDNDLSGRGGNNPCAVDRAV